MLSKIDELIHHYGTGSLSGKNKLFVLLNIRPIVQQHYYAVFDKNQMMSWIRKDERIANWLYSQRVETTFAIQFGENLEMTKYATISEGPYNDRKNYYETNFAEPYDIICRISVRKEPSADFSEQHSIAHNPEDNEVYIKRGVGRFEDLDGICPNALNVEYASDRSIVAECSECGTKTTIPIEDEPRISEGMEKNSNGETVTPCCYSTDWFTKLE